MERPWTLDQQADAKAIVQPMTFEDLFADDHERLYRALYLVVGNSHEAEELMQDAFIGVSNGGTVSTILPVTCIGAPSMGRVAVPTAQACHPGCPSPC